jgi:hypothetical protein
MQKCAAQVLHTFEKKHLKYILNPAKNVIECCFDIKILYAITGAWNKNAQVVLLTSHAFSIRPPIFRCTVIKSAWMDQSNDSTSKTNRYYECMTSNDFDFPGAIRTCLINSCPEAGVLRSGGTCGHCMMVCWQHHPFLAQPQCFQDCADKAGSDL